MTKSFPKPTHWQDFQIFIKELLNKKFDSNFDLFGRNGQAQMGIDILGTISGKNIGIQCKRLDSKLTLKLITDEVAKADTYVPKLQKYIFATTDTRDTHLQTEVNQLNLNREKSNDYTIDLWFWETIEDEINANIEIQKQYYDSILSKIDLKYKEKHIIDTLYKAFSRPAFSTSFKYENQGSDFLQAIKDTQEFMNTGKLMNRDGQYISGSYSYKKLVSKEDIQAGDIICDLLLEIRNIYFDAVKNGKIKDCGKNCFCIQDKDTETNLDKIRKELLKNLNSIFLRNNHEIITIKY